MYGVFGKKHHSYVIQLNKYFKSIVWKNKLA